MKTCSSDVCSLSEESNERYLCTVVYDEWHLYTGLTYGIVEIQASNTYAQNYMNTYRKIHTVSNHQGKEQDPKQIEVYLFISGPVERTNDVPDVA